MNDSPKHKEPARTLLQSFRHAFEGIGYALRERNMRIHLAASTLVIGLSLYLHIDNISFLFICMAVTLVILTEMINTGIENVVDIACQRRRHPLAKVAKDLAAGAVLVSAIFAVVVYAVVLFEPTMELAGRFVGK